MKPRRNDRPSGLIPGFAGLALLLMVGACKSSASSEGRSMKASGSDLWSENCVRCHNIRSPSEFSDAEWDIAVHHMRVRASLTSEESESIVEFLKASN